MKPLLFLVLAGVAGAVQPCRIEIVDKENGWPVPLVELRTTHESRYVSDNAGLIAIDDPELFGKEVWFHVKGHGYGVPKDGFGFEGIRTTPASGGKIRIEMERRNIAKRLGRLTGAGLFAEEQKLGGKPRGRETGVFGCDSVLMSRLGGELFWLWGDTTLPGYPLGIFHSTAAVTPLQPLAKFQPPLVIDYGYFRDAGGKPRGVAEMEGKGPTWLSGMTYLGDPTQPTHLVATYSKIENHMDEYEVGLSVWDRREERFKKVRAVWEKKDGKKPLILRGHPLHWTDRGEEWLLFGDPFPAVRCRAGYDSWSDPSKWEKIEAPASPRSAEDGSEVKPHRGSIAWSPFRKRWITVFTQHSGKPSAFGEIWYAEAGSPLGPWGKAVKILTHDNYTFYNPRIHSELTPGDASFVVFEGTYTVEFADPARPTPKFNYNQLLYRLDLDDPRLAGAAN